MLTEMKLIRNHKSLRTGIKSQQQGLGEVRDRIGAEEKITSRYMECYLFMLFALIYNSIFHCCCLRVRD